MVSHGLNYDGSPVDSGKTAAPDVEEPVRFWVPSIALSGLTIRREGEHASIISGALAGQMVVRLGLEGNRVVAEQRVLEGEIGRIRDIRSGPDGLLYVIIDDPEGHLYRLVPTADVARQGNGRSPL